VKESYFETRFRYDPKKEVMWKVLCKHLQQFIGNESRVIDVGAGYCQFINNISAGEKYALDTNQEVLNNYSNKKIHLIVASATDTTLEKDFFDVVFASNLLEHLSRDEILLSLRESNRILKKNGFFIILSPNFKYSYKAYFDDYTHKSIITDKSLSDMLNASGFSIERIFPKFLPFSADSKLPKSGLLIRLYLKSPWKPFAGQMLVIARKTDDRG